MLRVLLIGVSALTLACAGSVAQAGTTDTKAPTCRDAKGRAVPCPRAHAPQPAAPESSDGACLWLVAHGILAPCTFL